MYGTGSLTVGPTSAAVPIPGLSQTISVPSDSVVYVATNGGVSGPITNTNFPWAVDVFVTIDGQIPSQGLYRRIEPPMGFTLDSFAGWSLSAALSLSQGSHTIAVEAKSVASAGNPVFISGDGVNHRLNQGALTLMVLKK